ncbi:MAG: protein-glutamate methylesterase/protein-glutamine glutaminase [Burkholderiaceae bacterium]
MVEKQHRVLIVDDSKAMCQFLSSTMARDPSLLVVGCAHDPYEARELIKKTAPDVITLDIEMPKMDGITFLRNLMRLKPMPVVMLSSLTAAGAGPTLEALKIGAVDFMVKRHPAGDREILEYMNEICRITKSAAQVNVSQPSERKGASGKAKPEFAEWKAKAARGGTAATGIKKLITIGASTGGPEALRNVLEHTYSPDCAVTVCQHMPTRFMGPFAERLNQFSRYNIALAEDGEIIKPGHGYVAPGDYHLEVVRQGSNLVCKLRSGERVNGHMPSVDVMYQSAASLLGPSSLGVLLTGMGNDGAAGLKAMRDSGSLCIVQDERSSAVWGMPGSAVALDGADAILPLQDIGPSLDDLLNEAKTPGRKISEIAQRA